MRYFILLILLFSLKICLFAQFQAPNYFRDQYPQSARFDSLLRSRFENLAESYFVITHPLAGSITTYGPQFIKTYKSIKKRKDMGLVLVFRGMGGILPKDVPAFMQQFLGVEPQDLANIKYIVDDELWEELSEKRSLTRLLAFHRRELVYNEAEKLHSISPEQIPYKHVDIEFEKSLNLHFPPQAFVLERDNIYPYKPGYLLLHSETENKIYSINLSNGQTELILALDAHKSASIYCEYLAKDSAACQFAQTEEARVAATKRQVLKIDRLFVSGDSLYLALNIEVMERNTEEIKYKDDEGRKKVISKGTPFLNSYLLIGLFDMRQNKLVFQPISPRPKRSGEDVFERCDAGFKVKGDTLWTYLTFYPAPKKMQAGLAPYKLKGGRWQPLPKQLPNLREPEYIETSLGKIFFFEMNASNYMLWNCWHEIFEFGRDAKQGSFYGSGEAPFAKLKYAAYSEDTSSTQINYDIHSLSPIFGGDYLLSFYQYKEKDYIFELKNRLFKTVDLIDAKTIPQLQSYCRDKYRDNLLIDGQNNKIYILKIVDNSYVLDVFQLKRLALDLD